MMVSTRNVTRTSKSYPRTREREEKTTMERLPSEMGGIPNALILGVAP
jgi:hypothetical protein